MTPKHPHIDPDPCAEGGGLLRLEDARQRIIATVGRPEDAETLPLGRADGRVLARQLTADVEVPPFDNSAMDGYALHGSVLPATGEASLRQVGTAWAGRPFQGHVGPGECVRIMTGAPMPTGTDTVIMQEQVRVEGEQVTIRAGHRPGEHRRLAGESLARGAQILAAGTRLTPAHLGLAASAGVAEVSVFRRPRVAILSTGDELRSAGLPLGPGQIYDSNRCSLTAMLERLGIEVMDLGVIPDRLEATRTALLEASEAADVIISSGGVSVGDADFVVDVLRTEGQVGFWKVAIKPGKPLAFGRLGQAWFFGLPGNPVSSMVTFYQLVQPALRRLCGVDPLPQPLLVNARLAAPLRKQPGRLEFQRARLAPGDQGQLTVEALSQQGSNVMRSMVEADCFIVLPLEQGPLEAGEWVQVQPFAGLV
ncbi:MAG: gephyrin-like molybdotransferase Glp [Steroidobacteraceae bacterium]